MSSSTRASFTISSGGATVLVATAQSPSSRTARLVRSVVDSGIGGGGGGVVNTSSIDGLRLGDTAVHLD